MTVLPQPKAPGTAHVPPKTDGNNPSMTRSPVINGALPGNFSTIGRGRRTGQKWLKDNLCVLFCVSLNTSITTSSTKNVSEPSVPVVYILLTVPYTLGGHKILWLSINSFSYTEPMTSPPVMGCPSLKLDGRNVQRLSRDKHGISTPFGTYTSPELWKICSNGRWIPSKIVPIIPGPNSTDNGCFLRNTGSPTVKPEVSSYTWILAVSPSNLMISPTNFECPTRTNSYMAAPLIPSATTNGPDTLYTNP